jgi:hypothetical protein
VILPPESAALSKEAAIRMAISTAAGIARSGSSSAAAKRAA